MILIVKGCIPQRAIVGAMVFMACFVSYMLRVNISINLIAMVEPSASFQKNGPQSECIIINKINSSNVNDTQEKLIEIPDYGVRYKWDSSAQALILGSFFWGYILTSIPGGFIAERFGPTKTIGISILISAALTMLTPLAASWHYGVVIATRFIIGFLCGVIYPSLHCLISRWAPPLEKGKFIGALLGGTLGTVITWPLLGNIIEHYGWHWAFFVPGVIGLFWVLLWYYVVSDTPDSHPRISSDEKEYILKSLGGSVKKTKTLPPYKDIFSSIPFWALLILHFGSCWGLYFLMTAGPKFISEILGFKLGKSGVLASLPYLARMLFGFFFGWIGDLIRRNEWISVTATRKFFIIFSSIIPGLFLIGLNYIKCDALLAVALITLSLGVNGASTLTNLQNSQDLAPNFAGSLYGIVNMIGSTTGFITPALVGAITKEHNGLDEWHTIFWIGASVYIASGIVFMFFGTGETQPWNDITKTDNGKNISGVDNPAFDAPSEISKV